MRAHDNQVALRFSGQVQDLIDRFAFDKSMDSADVDVRAMQLFELLPACLLFIHEIDGIHTARINKARRRDNMENEQLGAVLARQRAGQLEGEGRLFGEICWMQNRVDRQHDLLLPVRSRISLTWVVGNPHAGAVGAMRKHCQGGWGEKDYPEITAFDRNLDSRQSWNRVGGNKGFGRFRCRVCVFARLTRGTKATRMERMAINQGPERIGIATACGLRCAWSLHEFICRTGRSLMFRKILLPIDLSNRHEQAVRIAAQLAGPGEGEVVLVHVVETIPGLEAEEEKHFYGRLEKLAWAHLEKIGEMLKQRRIRWRADVLLGHRGAETLCYARENGIDLIVLTSPLVDPNHIAAGWGSLSYKIGLAATCPVLLVK